MDKELINVPSFYDEHWVGMPDFQQGKIEPYAKIIVRVESREALEELSKRLEQPLTSKTKSAWFPYKSHWGMENNVWISDK